MRPLAIFMAVLCASSKRSVSSLCWEPQSCMQCFTWMLTNAEERDRSISLTCWTQRGRHTSPSSSLDLLMHPMICFWPSEMWAHGGLCPVLLSQEPPSLSRQDTLNNFFPQPQLISEILWLSSTLHLDLLNFIRFMRVTSEVSPDPSAWHLVSSLVSLVLLSLVVSANLLRVFLNCVCCWWRY